METLEVLKTLGLIILGGLSLYFQYNKKLQEKIKDVVVNAAMLIKKAEEIYKDSTKAGGEKFEYVVNQLHEMIPNPFNRIITKEMISNIVQSTFEEMEAYAKEQLDKVAETVIATDTATKG
ncbi:hypothetical protein EOM57_01185 [Candidatus Saccharibacteria bacterium]|nr:hypothetical protein [Candidatus Saccharibacteria bacterium]